MPASSPADARFGAAWTPRQRAKNDLIYGVIALLVALLTRIPRAASRIACRACGAIAYAALGRERRRARDRLARGLGRAPPLAAERLVFGAFLELGAQLADALALLRPGERAARTLHLDERSREVFRSALAEGRGVVFLSAHIGSWERMAALLVEEGFPVAAVARESYDPRITALYERIRGPRGVRSIYRGSPGASMAVARELARGGAVGFLVDLPGRGLPSAKVPLFGEDVDMPVGPARIALGRRCAVLVGTCAPALDGGRKARVVISRVPAAELGADPPSEAELLARIARALEAQIALWPLGWLGLFAHPRLQARGSPR